MRLTLALTLALSAIDQVTAEPADRLIRIRTLDPMVLTLVREGRRRSPTFAALVDGIEQSDRLVYVVRAHRLPHGREGYLAPLGSSGVPQLRVVLAMGVERRRAILVLAHEFQHVREVLNAGIALDPVAVEALFKRTGSRPFGTHAGEYETAAARQVMATVERELGTVDRDEREDDSTVVAGRSASQEAGETPPAVRLLVVNRANVRTGTLDAAEADATRIYRDAGVQTMWVNAGPDDVSDCSQVDFVVTIVSGPDTLHVAARIDENALGAMVRDSDTGLNEMAFVFFDRIKDATSKHLIVTSRVLGVAIAHEVGHLLLPFNGHSPRGIMRAGWNWRPGVLEYFTIAQAEEIRQRLTARQTTLTCSRSGNSE